MTYVAAEDYDRLREAAREALESTDWDEEKEACDCPSCSAVRRLREVLADA